MKKFYLMFLLGIFSVSLFAQHGRVIRMDSLQYVDKADLEKGNDEPTYYKYGDTVTFQGVVTFSPLIYGKSASSRKACWVQDTTLNQWGGIMVFIDPGQLSGYSGSLTQLADDTKFFENFVPGYTIKATGRLGAYNQNSQVYLLPIESEIVDIPATIDTTKVIDPLTLSVDLFMKNDGSGGQETQMVTGEPYEGMMVRFEDVTVVDVSPGSSGRFYWKVQDKFGNKVAVDDNSGYYRNDNNTVATWLKDYTFEVPSIGTKLEYIQGVIEHLSAYGYEINPLLPSDIKIAASAPFINNVSKYPVVVSSSDNVDIYADISDNDGTISSASIFYSIGLNNKSFTEVAMSNVDGNKYKGTIPMQPAGSLVNYYIKAVDDSNLIAYAPDSFATGSAYMVTDKGVSSISDIQSTPFTSGASIWDGDTLQNLSIKAVVTATLDQLGFVSIQDDTKPYSGIFLRAVADDGLSKLRIGDSIEITSAIVTESFSVTYLDNAGGKNFRVLSRGNAIPAAVTSLHPDSVHAKIAEYSEAYEGMYVQFDNDYVVDLNADGDLTPNYGEFILGVHPDSTTGLRVDVDQSNYFDGAFNVDSLTLKQQLAYCRGILYYSYGNFKLLPRDKSDIAGFKSNYQPLADFSSDITSGDAPIKVQFMEEVSNSPIPLSFTWTFTGGNPASSSEANPLVEYAAPGKYDVTLKVSNTDGEDEVTKSSYINVTSLEDLGEHMGQIIIYPNPAVDALNLKGNVDRPERLNVKVVSSMGQVIQTQSVNIDGNYNIKINTQELASGVYLLQISNTKGSATYTFIKK